MNSKTKSHSISQNQLHSLSEDIIENIQAIFGYFGLDFNSDNKKFSGPCPVHGGDKHDAFNLYHQGPVYNWKCYTHQCHDYFVPSPVGLVRGLLSHAKYNWSGPSDNTVTFKEAITWTLDFLGKDLKHCEIEIEDAEKLTFVRQVKHLGNTNRSSHLSITREQIRNTLNIPAKYYVDRGYSESILNKYDVGLCFNKDKEMYGRVVVPIYNDEYTHMIGCTGRITLPFCPFCKSYHRHGKGCNINGFKHFKWKHNKGFHAEQHLYNYWFAKKHILESGKIILTEGPGDVWRLEEAGIHYGVAIFGTTLCPAQKTILDKSGALKIIILTDNGGPGREAASVIAKLCEKQYGVVIPEFQGDDIGNMEVNEVRDLCQKF